MELVPLILVGLGAIVFLILHRRTERRWERERQGELRSRG